MHQAGRLRCLDLRGLKLNAEVTQVHAISKYGCAHTAGGRARPTARLRGHARAMRKLLSMAVAARSHYLVRGLCSDPTGGRAFKAASLRLGRYMYSKLPPRPLYSIGSARLQSCVYGRTSSYAYLTRAGSLHRSVGVPGRAESYGVIKITDTSRTFHIEKYGF